MNVADLRKLLDACFIGKRVVETLPELPRGMKPRHIHVLEAVYEIQRSQGACRVSDVSMKLKITTPSVTKLIQELEALDKLKKESDARDRRVVLVSLTEEGLACVKCHVVDLHSEWAEAMGDITAEQAEEVLRLLRRLKNVMPGKKEGKIDEKQQ